MADRRQGEWGAIPKRKTRFFKEGNFWYYDTREGQIRGPFDVLPEAEMDAKDFIFQQDVLEETDKAVQSESKQA